MPLFSFFMKGRGTHFTFHLCLALQFVLIVVTSGMGFKNQSVTVRCIAAEKRALLDFKKGLINDENLLASWASEDGECCKRKGVGCNNTTGNVVMLDLRAQVTDDALSRSYSPIYGEIGSSIPARVKAVESLGPLF
ncbi:hypothetical protein V6N13_021785 [Hibiscus sabdariffa]|uniref:Leucine-rich repeat-containing N-terminal plant-type domain-containing protein n=1 Tax=Hibiscus sabdariffa TaxID=183260 RepID=A0ABR2CPN2_9ROSI